MAFPSYSAHGDPTSRGQTEGVFAAIAAALLPMGDEIPVGRTGGEGHDQQANIGTARAHVTHPIFTPMLCLKV